MPVRGSGLASVWWPFSGAIAGHFQAPLLVVWFVSPLATWFRQGELGLMGRPYTLESLGGKQGKPGGLVVQTPGAKCGDRGQVKRALQIGVTEGSGHVCPGSWIVLLSHPATGVPDVMVSTGVSDVRYPERWNVGRTGAGYEISGWNEESPSGWNEGFPSGWNEMIINSNKRINFILWNFIQMTIYKCKVN